MPEFFDELRAPQPDDTAPTGLPLSLVGVPALRPETAGNAPLSARTATAQQALRNRILEQGTPFLVESELTRLDQIDPGVLPEGAILVLAPAPAAQIAEARAAGLSREAAIAAWLRGAKRLVAILSARRNAVLLASDEAALADPGGILAAAARTLGLPEPAPDHGPGGIAAEDGIGAGPAIAHLPPPPTTRQLVEAEFGLLRHPGAGELIAALAPQWLRLADPAPGTEDMTGGAEALLARMIDEERAAGGAEARALLRETEEAWLTREADRIESNLARLAEVRQKTEARSSDELRRLNQEIGKLRKRAERAESAGEAAETRMRAETDRLTTQLEDFRARHSALKSEAAELTTRLRNVETAAAKKVTRAAMKEATERARKQGAEAARQALRERLTKEHAAKTAKLEKRIEDARRDHRSTKEALAQEREELGRVRAALDAARGEIDTLYRSTSWRVTRPLRGIRRLFSRGADD